MSQVATYGPYLGELGHEVRAWAPWVRHQISIYPDMKHIVISKSGHSVLYPDSPKVRFIPFDLIDPVAGDFMTTVSFISQHDQVRYETLMEGLHESFDVRFDSRPSSGGKYAIDMARRSEKQQFLMDLPPLREDTDIRTPRVGVFVRNREHGNDRNLGLEFWNEAIECFMSKYPLALFFSLGHRDGNLCARWSGDRLHRGEFALWKTVHEMSHVDFVWGESSGTMHLALAACGKDICVSYMHNQIRDRYVKEDNWHNKQVAAINQVGLTPEDWAAAAVKLAELQIKDRLGAS